MNRILIATILLAAILVAQPVLGNPVQKDMVSLFKSSKKYAYLSDSLTRIGKEKLLKEPGPYTFFIPENDAFDNLEYGKWVEVWKNKPLLTKVLMRGLVKGHFDKKSFQDGKILHTVNGGTLTIEKHDGRLWIGKSRIVDTDIECSNGIVHVVSKFISKEADAKHR